MDFSLRHPPGQGDLQDFLLGRDDALGNVHEALAHLLCQPLSLLAFRIELLIGDLEVSGPPFVPGLRGCDVVAELLLKAQSFRDVEQGDKQAVLRPLGIVNSRLR